MMRRIDSVTGVVCCLLAAWASACSDGKATSNDGNPSPMPAAGGPGTAGGGGNPNAGAPSGGASAAGTPTMSDDETDPLAGFPTGAAQLQVLCARNNGDQIAQAFCGATPPTVTSLRDLQLLVGLDLTDPHQAMGALITQSTSIARRLTTPINPRAIIVPFVKEFGPLVPEGEKQPAAMWTTMAFVRGEQFVELASKDPSDGGVVRFYLFKFEQECNRAPGGCIPADLFTPDGEQHITSFSLYEDVDLANTSLDCAQCHQMQGPGTRKTLITQEYGYSWGHWAMQSPQLPELEPLCAKFNEMHAPDEDYAGIPNRYIGCTPGPLTNVITGPSVGGPQALDMFLYHNDQAPEYSLDPRTSFSGKAIFSEVGYAGMGGQPDVNVPIGVSATWQMLHESYVPGQSLEVPYHDLYNTDAQKMRDAITSYKAVMAGMLPRTELPDMSDMLLAEGLADMSIAPQPNLTGRQILTAMCQQCHNSQLDQTLSRARFNVQKLDEMSRAEKDEAIRRMHLPKTSARHMPPHRFHELSAEQIELASQELMQ